MKRKRLLKTVVSLLVVAGLALSETYTAAARTVTEIQEDKDELEDEIDELDDEIYAAVLEIEELDQEISDVEAEIADTQQQLEECKAACDEQYASMKKRIQYMYEAPNETVLEMLMESKSISDFLNKIEYVNDVYQYDRDKFDAFEETKAEMEELEAALESEEADLASYKASAESKKDSLNSMLESKKDELKDVEKELKVAKEKAKKAAAKRAAALAKQRASSNASVQGTSNPEQTTDISGSAVVAYAEQFVGGKYVWGGTSLTSGVDCSGFVQQVYAHFGITWSSRMTSASFRTVGKEVSYDYMQPGDIVCYPGHVAIYAGGGLIVEAQSSSTGITCNRSVNCHTILAIRRVI